MKHLFYNPLNRTSCNNYKNTVVLTYKKCCSCYSFGIFISMVQQYLCGSTNTIFLFEEGLRYNSAAKSKTTRDQFFPTPFNQCLVGYSQFPSTHHH